MAYPKKSIGAVFPDNALGSESVQVEPLITPNQLRQRYLFGLPLVSQIVDPITKKVQQLSDEAINDIILGCVAQIELEFKIDIMPVQRDEKHPFDQNDYGAYGFFRTHHTPVAQIDDIQITPANGIDLYQIPDNWVETGNIVKWGQINIVPIDIGAVSYGITGMAPTGGAFFLSVISLVNWVPAYWRIRYTSGFPSGQLPRAINEMVGCLATIEILSMLASTYARSNSTSLGLDGLSQSVSNSGPQLFETRIAMLQDKYQRLGKKFRANYLQKIFTDTI